jgi:hypothetical protein
MLSFTIEHEINNLQGKHKLKENKITKPALHKSKGKINLAQRLRKQMGLGYLKYS